MVPDVVNERMCAEIELTVMLAVTVIAPKFIVVALTPVFVSPGASSSGFGAITVTLAALDHHDGIPATTVNPCHVVPIGNLANNHQAVR